MRYQVDYGTLFCWTLLALAIVALIVWIVSRRMAKKRPPEESDAESVSRSVRHAESKKRVRFK